MDVVFLSPVYPPEMRHYVRGLSEVGARVWGVGDSAETDLGETAPHLAGYLRVPRLLDEADVLQRTTAWLRGKDVQRVLTNWEILVVLAARMREAWGVEGMNVETAIGFRDKDAMKRRVAAAGLRVPRARRASTVAEVREAAEAIGFPLVVKPLAGAGSADTYRVEDADALEAVIARVGHVPVVSVEEFIEGEEFTYDTICIGGKPVYENVAQYLPKPLEARSEAWISPVIITVRDLEQSFSQGGLELGRKVLSAMGMGDGFTHMEWFYTPAGEAVFGEIGARPGGAHLVDQMNYTGDVDLFREWAQAVCWHRFESSTARHYNCAIVFKRARGEGLIKRIDGLGEYLDQYGAWVVEERLLRPGTPRRDWRKTLLSDGFIILRHPEFEVAKGAAFAAATDIAMYAE